MGRTAALAAPLGLPETTQLAFSAFTGTVVNREQKHLSSDYLTELVLQPKLCPTGPPSASFSVETMSPSTPLAKFTHRWILHKTEKDKRKEQPTSQKHGKRAW